MNTTLDRHRLGGADVVDAAARAGLDARAVRRRAAARSRRGRSRSRAPRAETRRDRARPDVRSRRAHEQLPPRRDRSRCRRFVAGADDPSSRRRCRSSRAARPNDARSAPAPQMPMLTDDGRSTQRDSGRRTCAAPTDARPLVDAPRPAAPTMQAAAPGRTDTEPTDMGPDFVESPSMFTPITHEIPTPRRCRRRGAERGGIERAEGSVRRSDGGGQPTEALLARRARSRRSRRNPVEEALEAEFRQVYRDFIETKQALRRDDRRHQATKSSRASCAPTASSSSRRYACKTVKFQVYVKDGKAALKATPVTALAPFGLSLPAQRQRDGEDGALRPARRRRGSRRRGR